MRRLLWRLELRAEGTVRCAGLQRAQVASTLSRNAEFRGSLAENGGHHRATQSPMACVRWVGHGIGVLGASGGARAQARVLW